MIEIRLNKKLTAPNGMMELDLELQIEDATLVTILGKSGAGKTSLFSMLSGLMKPDHGRIEVYGETWYDSVEGIFLPPQKRDVGLVFQDYTLFPNMTVRENLLFAVPKKEDKTLVDHLIEITDIGDLQHRKPATLSGGQKQRVALARSLVRRPKLLLLDEPLSALDREMRQRLQQYVLKVHREFKLNTMLISHDVTEIIRMSDRVIEIDHGKLLRQGSPLELFTRDKLNAKFQFTGEVINLVRQDFIYIVTVLIGNELVKVVANDEEMEGIDIGDKVLVASKAFNPIIHKL